jgi:hypothetical protein
MIDAAKRFKFANFANLAIEPSALYVLAAQRTHEGLPSPCTTASGL